MFAVKRTLLSIIIVWCVCVVCVRVKSDVVVKVVEMCSQFWGKKAKMYMAIIKPSMSGYV